MIFQPMVLCLWKKTLMLLSLAALIEKPSEKCFQTASLFFMETFCEKYTE